MNLNVYKRAQIQTVWVGVSTAAHCSDLFHQKKKKKLVARTFHTWLKHRLQQPRWSSNVGVEHKSEYIINQMEQTNWKGTTAQ